MPERRYRRPRQASNFMIAAKKDDRKAKTLKIAWLTTYMTTRSLTSYSKILQNSTTSRCERRRFRHENPRWNATDQCVHLPVRNAPPIAAIFRSQLGKLTVLSKRVDPLRLIEGTRVFWVLVIFRGSFVVLLRAFLLAEPIFNKNWFPNTQIKNSKTTNAAYLFYYYGMGGTRWRRFQRPRCMMLTCCVFTMPQHYPLSILYLMHNV